ncbi:MAG: endonuclease [Stutzerimonas stutzeri]|nr:MAG: endonuclease [Stutzerimonas stutzeri]
MSQNTLLSAKARSFIADVNGIGRYSIKDRDHWMSLRKRDVTASVAGAVLGIHPYQTPFGLWSLKSGQTSEDAEETSAMLRGTLLEPVAIQMLKRERPGWKVDYPLGHYWRHEAVRIGATPDALAIDPDREGFGAVQIKTVEPRVFRDNWVDPDTRSVEVPLWIAVQALIEAKLTGASWAAVAVMRVGHGVDFDVVDIPIHEGVWARLVDQVGEFWKRVRDNDPPPADFARDGELLASIYAQDDGTEVDLSGDNRINTIMAERAELKVQEAAGAAAVKKRKELDTEILAKLGTSRRGRLADGRLIDAPTIKRAGYSVAPSSYRQIKIKGEAA